MGTELAEARAQYREALITALQDRLGLVPVIAAVDVASEDEPGLGSTTERAADLDHTLEQTAQPRAAPKGDVACEFGPRH